MGRHWNRSSCEGLILLCAEGENQTTSFAITHYGLETPRFPFFRHGKTPVFPTPFPFESLPQRYSIKEIATQTIAMAFSFICAEGETRTLTPCDTRF